MNNEELFAILPRSISEKYLNNPKKLYIGLVYIAIVEKTNISNFPISYKGIQLNPRQAAITKREIADRYSLYKLTEEKVRGAIKQLEKEGYIRVDSKTARNKFTVITVRKVTDPKTAESIANTDVTEISNNQIHRQGLKFTDRFTDPKTAESIAKACIEKLTQQ